VLAEVAFSYREVVSRERRSGQDACRFVPVEEVQAGLSRGIPLVDQYLTLKQAAQLHHLANDSERAFRLASGLLSRFSALRDPDLTKERDLIREFHNNLAFLTGRSSEVQYEAGKSRAALVGTWRRTDRTPVRGMQEYLVVWPDGSLETVEVTQATRAVNRAAVAWARPIPEEKTGVLRMGDRNDFEEVGFEISGDTLRLKAEEGSQRETRTYRRVDRVEFPAAARAERGEVDALSGLPAPARAALPLEQLR
jgi:hypothetical protein